jgi:DNA-binding PadR family transcriptional regulator
LDSWEQHMTVLQIVLQKLHENGFLSTHWNVNGQLRKLIG